MSLHIKISQLIYRKIEWTGCYIIMELEGLKREEKSFSLESRAHLVLKRFIVIGYWIRLNNKQPVCFQTRGNSPGIVKANVDGFIGAIKLVYLYGRVTCDKRNKYYQSFWGCSNHPNENNNSLNIYLTDIPTR